MKAWIRDYEIELEMGKDVFGLPDRILIIPDDTENDYVWIYTRTETTTFDKIPPRLIRKKGVKK